MEDEEEGVLISKERMSFMCREEWRDNAGRLHRLSGPAVIYNDGEMWWYKRGKRHRDDGPAIECPSKGNEDLYWYKDDKPYKPTAHEIMLWKMKKKES